MSSIVSIATRVPGNRYSQEELHAFADKVYCTNATDSRKLKFLYSQSGIAQRFSVIPDFNSHSANRMFFPDTDDLEPFPNIEKRMDWFNREAVLLSADAISECIQGKINANEITHLITVSCTGLCAPGLDLQLMEALELPKNIIRTSVNFMGCYAAIHALKMADAFCRSTENSNVIIVCTELCTLHFQKTATSDNITSSLLFSDGCAAVLIQQTKQPGLRLLNFYSELFIEGKNDMAWEVGSTGFQMTLSAEVPTIIKKNFAQITEKGLLKTNNSRTDVQQWCIHPGGRKILDAISDCLEIEKDCLHDSYEVLHDYGNMSSASILFVLKKILDRKQNNHSLVFGAAFGPGLTVETFTAIYD